MTNISEKRSATGAASADLKMRTVRREDPEYPESLRGPDRMPDLLYCIGRMPDPEKKSAAIVGARSCSRYGLMEARRFAAHLAENGVQIISGMAAGIDSAAQQAAVDAGGSTFAVLGCGADICYPESSRALYRKIPEKGGLISEFEPGSPPLAWHFPIRNRIISALADVVLVVEARRRSGSLITAEYALEQGKIIYAVPGRNGDCLSAGCNHLIEDGAGIARSPDQLLQEMGIMKNPGKKAGGGSRKTLPEIWKKDASYRRIYALLEPEPKSLGQIAEETGMPPEQLSGILMNLCLGGLANETGSGFFCLAMF